MNPQDRRRFLQTSAAVAAATMAELPAVHAAESSPPQEIKIGLIGCGGRGTGALFDALGAATRVIYPAAGYHTEDVVASKWVEKKDIKVIALADLFEDRLNACKGQLQKLGITIPAARCFVGFDGYKKLLEIPEINYVIQATPPHFRPDHVKLAIEAGKNVFMEKPAAVDVPGVRTVLEAGALARKKNLGIACGTQRRHLNSYRECIERIKDGAIGEIVYGRCYWNGGQIWVIDRQPGWSDVEYQIRNWNHFTWMSGDHYVEQHVHNLDIMNWALGHPVRAVAGLGGRQVRTGSSHGYVYDHFAVEFEYPNGVRVFSQARQIDKCENKVEEALVGTLGESNLHSSIRVRKGGKGWRFRGSDPNPYQQEHVNLMASIRSGKPINEAQAMAESTMTGILGRECVYSGRSISWDELMKSDVRLGPPKYEFGAYPCPPVPMPGKYQIS
ncbi:MAG: Gfo/Idh/MocA family oxidoreductase [Gemmataceae bacterium]